MAAVSAPFPMTRGRRAALIIGVPVCLLLVANTGLDLVANLGEGRYPVSYTVPASAKSLDVSVAGGHLTIRQTAAGRATLVGTARYSLVSSTVTEHTSGSGTTVGYRCRFPVGECELDATVNVPAALPVTANTDGGDVTVTGTTGQVTLSTGGGNIAADHTSGRLTLTASGGNIDATGVSSTDVAATTGGGNIEIDFTTVPSSVQVSTSGGNITLVLPPGAAAYRVTAHTDGGNVTDTLTQSQSAANVITATSGGGDITLRQRQ